MSASLRPGSTLQDANTRRQCAIGDLHLAGPLVDGLPGTKPKIQPVPACCGAGRARCCCTSTKPSEVISVRAQVYGVRTTSVVTDVSLCAILLATPGEIARVQIAVGPDRCPSVLANMDAKRQRSPHPRPPPHRSTTGSSSDDVCTTCRGLQYVSFWSGIFAPVARGAWGIIQIADTACALPRHGSSLCAARDGGPVRVHLGRAGGACNPSRASRVFCQSAARPEWSAAACLLSHSCGWPSFSAGLEWKAPGIVVPPPHSVVAFFFAPAAAAPRAPPEIGTANPEPRPCQ